MTTRVLEIIRHQRRVVLELNPMGLRGLPGARGLDGLPGHGLDLQGTVSTTADLPTETAYPGDCWIAQADAHVWVFDGAETWFDAGTIQGERGEIGPTGQPGQQGIQGPAGARGSDGPSGADGVDGAIGPVGPMGPVGPQGDAGEVGPASTVAGPQGPQGPAGHSPVLTWSADQVAIDGAVTGPHLTGPTGPQGPAGSGGTGAGVTDGDKGDIVVSESGAVWTFDPGVVSTAARALLDDSTAAAMRATLELGTAATTATTAYATAAQGTDARTPIVTGLTDIGAALADGDEFPVYDLSVPAIRKSGLLRLWTYVSGKIGTLGGAAFKDVPAAATRATAAQVPLGDDPRLVSRGVIVPLSYPNANLFAENKKAVWSWPENRTITGFTVYCDPATKPSATHAIFDLNTLHATTGVATSLLTTNAQISTGTSSGNGTIAGSTYSYIAGTLLSIDVDAGTDGRGYFASITTTLTG